MSTQIKQSLLNKTVTVSRPTPVENSSGDESNALVPVDNTVKARITRHDQVGQDAVHRVGAVEAATHRMFCNAGIDIQATDKVIDGSNTYTVVNVNDEPGGAIDHHYEVELSIENTG